MSIFKKITRSVGNVVAKPVHAVKSLATGDVKQAVKDIKNSMTGGVFEVAKRELGISTDQMLGLESLGLLGAAGAAAGAGAGAAAGAGSAGAAAGSGGLLGSLFGSDNNSGLLGSIFGTAGNSLSSILGSVVKGAVGVGADYFTNQQYYKDQRRLNEQTFAQNRQLADEAYQRDVAMWKLQNAYNAPAQQMQRLEKAGLNPNLVYGGGNVTGNTAGSPPTYPQVTAPSSKAQKLDLVRNVLGIFDQYQSIKNQALENQREAARIALQSRALDIQEENARFKEEQDERRFQIMMANLGYHQDDSALRRQEAHEQNAWRRFKDDEKKWQSDYDAIQKNAMFPYGYQVRKRQAEYIRKHRKPMYMDYL